MIASFLLQFLIILTAMLVAGVAGYFYARHRIHVENDVALAQMSAEVLKMRRRAAHAEADASATHQRLTSERRRLRRSA